MDQHALIKVSQFEPRYKKANDKIKIMTVLAALFGIAVSDVFGDLPFLFELAISVVFGVIGNHVTGMVVRRYALQCPQCGNSLYEDYEMRTWRCDREENPFCTGVCRYCNCEIIEVEAE